MGSGTAEGPQLGLPGLDTGSRSNLEQRRANVATARADRATRRAVLAEARAGDAEASLAAIRSSKAWRLTWPLRRLAFVVRRPAPADLAGGPNGAGPDCAGVPAGAPADAAGPAAHGTLAALLLDDAWPQPDRDSGSIDIVNMADALRDMGYEVQFAVDASRSGMAAADAASAQAALAARGVRCRPLRDAADLDGLLRQEAPRLRLVLLNRVYCGGEQLERVRAVCPDARIVFNTVDLHYLRIGREAALTGDPALAAAVAPTKAREEWLAAAADVTIVVSQTESRALAAAVPGANVFVLPLARAVRQPQSPFSARDGIGFIGGFAHAPNVDAVRWFLAEVWPLVLAGEPDCRFSIVGADLPPDILRGQPGRVEYLGPVTDVGPWFEGLRATVAPLRFGAGLKGKVVSSLAAGVPCVATGVAAEGMALQDGVNALLADAPVALAGRLLSVLRDEAAWTRLSRGGLVHAAAAFSIEPWRNTLRDALWTIDALPGGGSREG